MSCEARDLPNSSHLVNTEKHSKMQSELELARAAMIAKRFGGNVTGASTGGEGTVRRKKKGAHKSLGG